MVKAKSNKTLSIEASEFSEASFFMEENTSSVQVLALPTLTFIKIRETMQVRKIQAETCIIHIRKMQVQFFKAKTCIIIKPTSSIR